MSQLSSYFLSHPVWLALQLLPIKSPCFHFYLVYFSLICVWSVSPNRIQLPEGRNHDCLIYQQRNSLWHTDSTQCACSMNGWTINGCYSVVEPEFELGTDYRACLNTELEEMLWHTHSRAPWLLSCQHSSLQSTVIGLLLWKDHFNHSPFPSQMNLNSFSWSSTRVWKESPWLEPGSAVTSIIL